MILDVRNCLLARLSYVVAFRVGARSGLVSFKL